MTGVISLADIRPAVYFGSFGRAGYHNANEYFGFLLRIPIIGKPFPNA